MGWLWTYLVGLGVSWLVVGIRCGYGMQLDQEKGEAHYHNEAVACACWALLWPITSIPFLGSQLGKFLGRRSLERAAVQAERQRLLDTHAPEVEAALTPQPVRTRQGPFG